MGWRTPDLSSGLCVEIGAMPWWKRKGRLGWVTAEITGRVPELCLIALLEGPCEHEDTELSAALWPPLLFGGQRCKEGTCANRHDMMCTQEFS